MGKGIVIWTTSEKYKEVLRYIINNKLDSYVDDELRRLVKGRTYGPLYINEDALDRICEELNLRAVKQESETGRIYYDLWNK